MKLYGHRDSGHACKVALALSLARVPVEIETVDIWGPVAERPSAFLNASPLAQVPCLILDDGTALTQSGAILLELAERLGVLGGESAEGLRRGREVVLWEANRIGMCLPQLIEARRPGGDVFPAGAVAWLEMRYRTDCAMFDRLLADADFFHGDRPGVGDCAVWGYVQWVEKAGQVPSPAMARWSDRMRGLEGMRTPEAFFPR